MSQLPRLKAFTGANAECPDQTQTQTLPNPEPNPQTPNASQFKNEKSSFSTPTPNPETLTLPDMLDQLGITALESQPATPHREYVETICRWLADPRTPLILRECLESFIIECENHSNITALHPVVCAAKLPLMLAEAETMGLHYRDGGKWYTDNRVGYWERPTAQAHENQPQRKGGVKP